jgi:hypothetical protein
MGLAKMIIPSKTAWCEYPGLPGFEVQLAHLTRDELMKIRGKSLNTKVNRKTRAMEEEIDSDIFQSLYISAVIKDWKGLKYKYLPKLVPTDISGVDEEDELPYAQEDAEILMKNAADFDSWVSSILEDVENFTQSS